MIRINIDEEAGFCFGVKRAIDMAEQQLKKKNTLYCLGHIVHNEMEEERLRRKGLQVIDHQQFNKLHHAKVLIRAHGEPPATYRVAEQNNLQLVEATCPVVLRLQEKVRRAFREAASNNGQVVIYGKKGHPEVVGLSGHAGNKAIVVEDADDLDQVNVDRPVYLFAQTTKNPEVYQQIIQKIRSGRGKLETQQTIHFTFEHSICRQVSGKVEKLRKFAALHDLVVFAGGKNSSNSRQLFDVCRAFNHRSYFITGPSDLKAVWFEGITSVGITGATSTPRWLLKSVADSIESMLTS